MVFGRIVARLFFAAAIVAFCWLQGFAQTRTEARDTPLWIPLEKFDEKRDAAADIQLAVAEAKRSGRHVLLDVGGEWCVWCHRLDSLFVKNPDLNEYLHANFVVVKVNWSKNNKNEEVLSRYPKVAGYPHLFVLDETGRLLHSQDTSELEEGKGHSREKMFAFLRTWARN
ncbi:thioredoxin family protein [Sphingobacteriales bacterium CHB3]|nr:thioredoxin family protein [Sphingobacteriales bacterium CHB3]